MEWREQVDIERPVDEVFEAVLDQHVLMQWSAWPEATGFTCAVEGDGRSIGSTIVFTDRDGVEQGRQRITAVEGRTVRNRLRNRAGRGRVIEPEIDFTVEPNGAGSRVLLDFRVEPPVPALLRPIAHRYLRRSIRPLHRKDLEQLKALVERPRVDG